MCSKGYGSCSACLAVCLRLFSHYRLRGGLRAIPTASVLQGHEKQRGDFAEMTAFERYNFNTIRRENKRKTNTCRYNQHWLIPRPGLVRLAHRGRIKLLRGYVSKSSTAVNPLTITQLACERYNFLALWVADVQLDRVAWTSPSISGAHAYNIIFSNNYL